MFSRAQYEATIHEIQAGMTTFGGNLDKMIPVAAAAVDHWYVPDPIADGVMWLARETVAWGRELLDWFIDLLKGAAAPIYMLVDSWHWTDIKGKTNGVAADLSTQNLAVDDSDWSGRARDAYLGTVDAQSTAAGRIGSIAGNTANTLLVCGAAGLAFYLALAAVLVKLIIASITALAAFGTGVFSWAGAAIILEEAGVNTAIIATAVTTLTAFLTAQVTAMVGLHGEAVDPTSFPRGVWPNANTAQYSDGTVKDGDADWSLSN